MLQVAEKNSQQQWKSTIDLETQFSIHTSSSFQNKSNLKFADNFRSKLI